MLGYLGDITQAQLNANPKAGYTQGSLVGQSGIEAQYEQYLRGVNGSQALSVNASGDVVGTLSRKAPQIGDTVVLNIDTGLQEEVQNDLASQIMADRKTPDAEDGNKLPPAINGAAIVMNPQNGQVLAMASYPTYDLNQWVGGISSADYAALTASGAENNNAIQGEYTPGSTFKLITATADLQDGVYSPSKYYDDTGTFKVANCTGGSCNFTDNVGDSGGEYNLATALTVSSDSYFYNLGELFWEGRATYGANAIQNVAAQYGEGVSTGIDLPNEVDGRVDSQTEREELHKENPTAFPNTTWYTGDNVEMAFGQGATALTPIEQAVAYATFANGGTRYAPEVASEIVDPTTGKVVTTIAPKVLGHVSLPPAVSAAHPAGPRGRHRQPEGDGLRRLPGLPDQLEPGRQDRDGHQPRGQGAEQLVRGLRAQPQPAVRGAGGHRRGRVRGRGGGAVGAQYLQLHRGQPDRRREDADRHHSGDVHRCRRATRPSARRPRPPPRRQPPTGAGATPTTTTTPTTAGTTTTTSSPSGA